MFRHDSSLGKEKEEAKTFMSSVGVICKDDYSGEARVFIEQGIPPYLYMD